MLTVGTEMAGANDGRERVADAERTECLPGHPLQGVLSVSVRSTAADCHPPDDTSTPSGQDGMARALKWYGRIRSKEESMTTSTSVVTPTRRTTGRDTMRANVFRGVGKYGIEEIQK